MQHVFKAREAYWEAQRNLEKAINEAMPVGSIIQYKQGKHLVEAEVIKPTSHGTEQFWVRGKHGKEYVVSHWRVYRVIRKAEVR